MASIEQQLRDLIEANIPEQAAGAMRHFIVTAEQDKKDLIASQREAKDLAEAVDTLDARVQQQNAEIFRSKNQDSLLSGRETDVTERERLVQLREDRQALLLAQHSLRESDSRVAMMLALVDKVFGHPGVQVESNKYSNISVPYTDQYNNRLTDSKTESENETKTTTPTKT